MEIKDFEAPNELERAFHPVPDFPMWEIAVVRSNHRAKKPTGYAILKQKGREDVMIVNRDHKGEIWYDAMIPKQHVRPVLNSYRNIRVLRKQDGDFTIIGERWDGSMRTLAMAIIHEFSGNGIDPCMIPHHPDGDPTNDLDVIAIDDFTHGLVHGLVRPDTDRDAIPDIVRGLGNPDLILFFSLPEHSYSHKTYEMCEAIHVKDFFGWMPDEDYWRLIDVIGHEFDTQSE